MRNFLSLLALLAVTACQPSTSTTEELATTERDVPTPVSDAIGLAGGPDADIVRFLKVQSAGSPSLSPAGQQVAFRTRLTGDFQIWVAPTDRMGAPQQITFGNSVTFHAWAPGDQGIIYGVDKEGNERQGFYQISPDGLQEKELLPPSNAFRFFGAFRADGSAFTYSTTERNGTDFDIHVYDLTNNTDELVFAGKLGYYPVSFSPDGRYIVISESVGEDANNLYLLEVASSTLTQLNDPSDPSELSNIQWTADSQGFYLQSNQGRNFVGIAHYRMAEEAFSYLVTPEHDIEQIALVQDRFLHWVANEDGYSQHYLRDLNSGADLPTPNWPQGVLSLATSKGSATVVGQVSSPQIPGDLWAWSGSGEAQRITRSNHAGVDLEQMVLPQAHQFTARDGLTIHGLLYAPENLSSETPVVIRVHGGPTSQARPRFDALSQYLIQQGFAIFDLNFRGSTGYGKAYARENNLRKRENELYDLEDAVQYLSSQNIGNAKQMGIMGGSYGGYLTMAALTRLPKVFRTGVAFVGVSNWITALEGASPALKASDRQEYGDIDDPDDREFFTAISPITYIDQVEAPAMVLHGANDPRDPVTESDEFVDAIRANGGEVTYLRFPDEGHGIRKMNNRITAYVQVAEFLEKHLTEHVE